MMDIIVGYMRLSHVFDIPAKDIRADFKFGEELASSFTSPFRANEMRYVEYDIEDMLQVLDPKGPIEVDTVKDYVIL